MRLSRLLLAPLAALALWVLPAVAFGAANHPFLHASEPIYEDACGVARAGGLYISDYYHDTVFTPAGKIAPESKGSGPCKIELDAAGDLYVNDWHEKVVKYSSSELLPGAGIVIDSDNPTGLSVEQASGDLYVAHRTYIAKYSPAGVLLAMIGTSSLEEAYGVAVSEFPETAGYLYVPDAATRTVKIFDAGGTLIGKMDGAATPRKDFIYFRDGEITVDNSPTSPSYGHLFVLDAIGHGLSESPAAVLDEFNAKGAYRGQIAGFTDAEPSGITLDHTTHNVFVTSGNSEGSKVFEYGPTSAAKTLIVTKEGSGEGIITSSPVGIACGSACQAEFNEGQTVTLFANPTAHSAFTGWSVSGSEPCPGTGSCTVAMAKAVTVKATFSEPAQQNLTLSVSGEGTVTSSPEGISCPSSCEEHFAQGRVVTLTATPAAHQRLTGWSGCTVQSSPAECKVTMAADEAVSASFEAIPQLSLAVKSSGGGQGTVTSYPLGISCPGACSASFDEGSTVFLMAAPSPGSGFAGFSGGGCTGTATLCAVSVTTPQSVGATFTGIASGSPGGVGASSSATFRLASPPSGSASTVLIVNASDAGTLVVAGKGVRSLKRHLEAGTSRVRVSLGHRARRALSRRGHLALRIALGFLPSGNGNPAVAMARLYCHTDPGDRKIHRP